MTPSAHMPCGNEDLLDAACEVLDRMYFASLAPAEEAALDAAADFICVQVGFRGSRAGILQLRIARDTAAQLQDDFTAGDGTANSREAILDGVGELANMICGSFLSNTDSAGEYRIARPQPAPADAFLAPAQGLQCSLSANGSLVECRVHWRCRDDEQGLSCTNEQEDRG